jgi:hypothetical protein
MNIHVDVNAIRIICLLAFARVLLLFVLYDELSAFVASASRTLFIITEQTDKYFSNGKMNLRGDTLTHANTHTNANTQAI